MNKSVKTVATNLALSTLDTMVAAYDNQHNGGAPILGGVWGLSKATIGSAIQLRHKKAVEWLEMMANELPHLKEEVLNSEEFQDTFVSSFESYLKERDAEKRILLRNIFKDYTSVKNPSAYPIERLYEITRQLTLYEASILAQTVQVGLEGRPSASITTSIVSVEATLHLISLGLLIEDTTPVAISDHPGIRPPKVYLSSLGVQFVKFIEGVDLKGASKMDSF